MDLVRSRLAAKIIVLISAVLIIGFGAATILAIKRESDLLVEQSKSASRRLTAALVVSIQGAMLQERPDVMRKVIQELRAASPVEGLDIFRRNGVEAFTDLATLEEVKKNADLAPEVLTTIQKLQQRPAATLSGPLFDRAVRTGQIQEQVEYRDGVALFTLHHPIPNQDRCQGCHGSDHEVRAVVRVATSMEPVFAEVRRQRNRQIVIGVLTIAAAGAVLSVAMGRIVVRPIEQLAHVARRIGAGDFTARAPVRSRDELGALGAAVNEMTTRLAGAYADLESKNTELATTLRELQESRQRLAVLEQVKGELSKFVPETVKRMLEENPHATELEKQNVDVSVLFLDIAGYTRLSEQIEPRRLNQLVQTYFSSFLEIIQGHHGDINETAGDGLMVIFQSERERGDHALNAARAAFAIRRRSNQLNEEYSGVWPSIELHMGINTGEALVGATKLGGAAGQRWVFTASGPTTNIAARIAASATGGEIAVGPTTAERVRSHFVLEALGEKSFKNVSQPIPVYRLIPPGVYERVT
jgi:class 3 adenylate cyclase/HAMP domain-containing protein